MVRENSHKPRTVRYLEREYLALAKALLGGDFDKTNLEGPLRKLQEYSVLPLPRPDDQGELESQTALLRALSLWYIVREDLNQGRFPSDSPQTKTAERLASDIVSIYAPKVISFLMNGNHEELKKLAAIVEAAKILPPIADQTSRDKKLQSLCKALGQKLRKPHKATGRIRLLLPLWILGFGDLPQSKRYEILEQAGLKVEEIPEDEALRQILTFYKIPSIRKTMQGQGELLHKKSMYETAREDGSPPV